MPKSQEASERSQAEGSSAHQTSYEHEPFDIARHFTFCLMEVAFTALAWTCYTHPRVLPWSDLSDIGDSNVRSGLTAVFSLWQTFAVGCVLDICSGLIRSRAKATPCNAQQNNLVPKIRWFVFDVISSCATIKVALLAYPVLVVLRIVGTATITVADGGIYEQAIQIGSIVPFPLDLNLGNIVGQAIPETLVESNMIVRLEQLYGRAWGYVLEPNHLIPLPTEDIQASQVIYETDVVLFHYDCQWRAPDNYTGNTITLGNNTWSARISSNATSIADLRSETYGSSIMFLLPAKEDMPNSLTGTSVYLFLGSNDTISSAPNSMSVNTSIDLSGLPTIFNPSYFVGELTPPNPLRAPLATLLVCDPNLQFLSRKVCLHPNANLTKPDATVLSDLDVPSPLNIHQEATRNLFSIIFNVTIMSLDSFLIPNQTSANYNLISSTMFLDGTTNQVNGHFRPFNLTTINQKVDSYTQSAFKSFIGGYRGQVANLRLQPGAFAQNVSGTFTSQHLTLRTSLLFAILHTALFSGLGVVLAGLLYWERVSRHI